MIIFLTALRAIEDKVRSLSLGAVDFITKPFDPDEVVAGCLPVKFLPI